MIPFENAFEIVMSAAGTTATEHVGLDGALGRVLAEDVYSDIDMPPFNKSAMDGYACRLAWIPVNVLENGAVRPVEYHGSAHLNALCEADGLICFPVGISELSEGQTVVVRQI